MVASIQQVKGSFYERKQEYKKRSIKSNQNLRRVDYYEASLKADHYPDPSLLDPVDDDHHDDI